MDSRLEVIFEEQLLVGESPVWDEKTKQLYFVDIRGRCYYCMDYRTGSYQKFDLSQLVGCMALCLNGDLLISMEDGVYRKSGKEHTLKPAHAPVKIKGERFNDGKVGPDGCYYVGTAGENFSGAFYRLQDGILTELFDRCGCSNGIDWDEKKGLMYYCDSREQKIEKFLYCAKAHQVSGRELVTCIPETLGSGDGMAIDADGNLWVAIWGGSCVQHIEGSTGRILETVGLPVTQISSCCFAGEHLDELIITTASVRIDKKEQPEAGKIFRLRTNTRGKLFHRYKY